MELKSGVARTAPSLLGKARKNLLMAGTALVAVVGVSGAAQAQCVATGAALGPLTGLAASATGTVNSVISTLNTVSTVFLTQSTAFVSAPGNPQPNQSGGGIWVRGIGGTVETQSTGTASNFLIPLAEPGTITCDTTTRQDFGGYQVGADISRLNIGGLNFHVGVTAGYLDSNAKDISPGGTFRGNFQIPFAGIYAAWTLGNFFADTQVRWDFYNASLSDPVGNISAQDVNGRSVSFTGNAGYRFDIGSGWFVEPSVGIIYSVIDTDALNIPGTFAFGTGLAPPASFQIERFESILARASMRVGTNFVSGGVAWQPFTTASVFHEFADDVRANLQFDPIAGGLPVPPFSATLDSTRVGTYGQFAVGIAGQIINTGWLGYARVDYRIGENIEGVNVNAGLRYQFTPEAIAAALVTKAPSKGPAMALAAVGPYNWSGFYIGGYVGSNFGQTDWDETAIPASPPGPVIPPLPTFFGGTGRFLQLDVDYQGFIGGGQIGYNYQSGALVVGLEVDGGGSNAKGGKACPEGVDRGSALFFNCEAESHWLATFTGRIGYAYDRALFYVKGGLAVGETTIQTVFNAGTQAVTLPGFTGAFTNPVFSDSQTQVGWTVGAGIEYGLTANWSAKAEYAYYDLGSDGYSVNPGYLPDIYNSGAFTNQTIEVGTRGNIVKVGVNYRFQSAAVPVVARY